MQALILRAARWFSRRSRAARAALFRRQFRLDQDTRILDLGSENGAAISAVLAGTAVLPANVYIADIDRRAVARGSQEFGYRPVVIGEDAPLPFPDGFFDIVHCSSVIEHVTVPKCFVWTLQSGARFRAASRRRQQAFAAEIQRVGRRYFVQTPNRHFPIESHTWLPLVGWLPRRLLIPFLRLSNRFWVKKASPDFYLLDRREFAGLFRGARIVEERAFGLTKSLIAVSA
jgi:SAM-dependent methyltransferase